MPGKNSRAEIFVWKREHVAGFLPVAAIRLADRHSDTATAARIQREPMPLDCELVATNVSPVAVIASPNAAWVAVNVSRKRALFASLSTDDREPLQLGFYHVDFNFSRKLKGQPISDTRVELRDGRVIKPDAIFQLTPSDQRERLYALEFWAGLDVATIERKLDTYRHALDDEAIERAFEYEHGVRVLGVFQHESTLRNVFERLCARSDFFGVFSPHLVFKTLDE
jgi:hypothetical protein